MENLTIRNINGQNPRRPGCYNKMFLLEKCGLFYKDSVSVCVLKSIDLRRLRKKSGYAL